MADNTTLNTGSGGDVIATDEITDAGSVANNARTQRIKPGFGVDGFYKDTSEVTPLPVNTGSNDIFSRQVTTSPFNDIDIQFFKAAPASLLNVTTANSATAAQNAGGALFSSSTNANGNVQAVTTQKTVYTAGSEMYCMFTAAFTAGIASSHMRIGLYDANEGFFIGYEGTTFGTKIRNNTADTATAKASFNVDTLTGAAGSLFTRDGVAEAIDLTKLNVYRIRFGWLGSAPIVWEVMAPDGHWVVFNIDRYPNNDTVPSIRNPNLPMTLDITKTAAAATDITIQTDCWGAGTNAGPRSANGDEFAFQTTTTLTNGSSYDSGVLALSPEFSQVHTAVTASHNGQITISWFSDPAGTDTIRTLVINYTASDGYQLFAAPAFSPYVKYVFLNNSGSNQTDFYFDTKFTRRAISPQILRVDGPVAAGMVASVSRSLITAYNGADYVNVAATTNGNLKVSLQEASDGLDTGNGAAGAETIRVAIANDDTNTTAIKTAVEILDNAVYVDDADWTATVSSHVLSGGVYSATPRTVTDGDTAPYAIDVNGHMITSAHAASVALADNVSNTANIMVDEADAFMASATFGYMYDSGGGNWDRLRGDATDGLLVNLGTNNDVTITGTVTVDLGANNDVQGDVAHDSADTGNPLKIGAKAETSLSGVTLVIDGDRTDLHAGVDGVLITRPHTNLEDIVTGNANDTTGNSTQVIAAAGAGIKQYLTSFTVTNTSATDTYCELKSGTTVMWTIPVPANGGVTHSFSVPLKPNAANEAWNFDMGAATTTAYCSMIGFKSKV